MTATTRRTGRVSTGAGAEIYYELHGDGLPVVLVGGLGDEIASWEIQVAPLAADHLVVAFDKRGVGQSSTPPGPYTIEEMADDAHDLVRELGLSPVAAVAFSMGGAISQSWALRHPADVDRLILTNTWGGGDALVARLIGHWAALAESGPSRRLLESLLLLCFSPDYLARRPDVIEEFLAMEPPRPDGFMAAAAACRAHDALADASQIDRPTLVIAGEHDVVTRPQLSVQLADRLPRADLSFLATSHAAAIERPDEWLVLATNFLDETPDRGLRHSGRLERRSR
jgi:3-oxoadipate enol-lactonase